MLFALFYLHQPGYCKPGAFDKFLQLIISLYDAESAEGPPPIKSLKVLKRSTVGSNLAKTVGHCKRKAT